jgi:hypothetical protein
MTEKLLHVSCLVRDNGLWELLRALEAHKVGNVEVRPVAPREERLALPAPGQPKRNRAPQGTVKKKVQEVMVLKQKLRLCDITRAAAINQHSAYSAIAALMEEGVVKRVSIGTYMRTKPDPTNGAAVS